jgi:hypothetical protein
MLKFRDVSLVSMLISIVVFLNSPAYADNEVLADAGGKGKGKSQGQGKAKTHGKASAAPKSHGKAINKKPVHDNAVKNVPAANSVRFVDQDRATITKYFSATPFRTTTLPPGIAKNLQRGKPLPPGIQKVFLPAELQTTLPVYPGYEYRIVGNDVVLINSNTGVVEDIFINALTN